MGITLPFWAQPRANRLDDRKLPNRFALAIDAKLPLYHRRFEAGGICRWLVVMAWDGLGILYHALSSTVTVRVLILGMIFMRSQRLRCCRQNALVQRTLIYGVDRKRNPQNYHDMSALFIIVRLLPTTNSSKAGAIFYIAIKFFVVYASHRYSSWCLLNLLRMRN